jgi:hypothetical protein
VARQPPGRDRHPADAVAHPGEQDPGLGIEALTVRQQILIEREFDILERELYRADNLADPVAIRASPQSARHVCLVYCSFEFVILLI